MYCNRQWSYGYNPNQTIPQAISLTINTSTCTTQISTVLPSLSPSLEDDGPPTVGVTTIGRTVEITIKEYKPVGNL